MKNDKPNRDTRQQLERKIAELQAQLVHVYHFAAASLPGASTDKCMGSGVFLQLTAVGGAEIIPMVYIRDGITSGTLQALREEICASYELATIYKPSKEGKK